MSWGEVLKINKNMRRSIDEQLQDIKYNPIRVITATGNYVPEKTGLYKVICVGKGGAGASYSSGTYGYAMSGGAGGVALSTLRLVAGTSYAITVSTTASFGNLLTATSGASAVSNKTSGGTGGTASGGDYNFPGGNGVDVDVDSGGIANGASVGVLITELVRKHPQYCANMETNLWYGDSVLNYGAAGPAYSQKYTTTEDNMYVTRTRGKGYPGLSAAVIIIPIEMEE